MENLNDLGMEAFDRYRAIHEVRFQHSSESGTSFEPRPDDVIVAGLRKSGTTWMQQILHQLRTNGDENFDDIYDVVPLLPRLYANSHCDLNQDQVAEPRLFKTHDIFEKVPKIDGATRFVVTVRHPYDSEYSIMKFVWKFIGIDRDMQPKEYEELMVYEKEKDAPDFADFICSWWPRRHDSNVLFIPYEDLKSDLRGSIQKVNTFLFGQPLQEPDLSRIVHLCSFEYMSQHTEKFAAHERLKCRAAAANVNYLPGNGMVRRDGGKVGQGQKMLPDSIRHRIDKQWKEKVGKEFGIESYDELYDIWQKEKKYLENTER